MILLKVVALLTNFLKIFFHQVILVANEDAIEKLPAELQVGLVMTIFEAKGLEFDDVLLYNFFKDSPVRRQWGSNRVELFYLLIYLAWVA